jgi:hypothetical protein
MLVCGTYLQVKLREIDIPVKQEWLTPKLTGLARPARRRDRDNNFTDPNNHKNRAACQFRLSALLARSLPYSQRDIQFMDLPKKLLYFGRG